MAFSPGPRKLFLAIHIAVSVGWVGAVAAYLALDVAAATTTSDQTIRAAYVGMDLIVRNVIVPLALAALLTGIIVSLGTKWGLFRHYWVLISLVLTLLATVVLLVELGTIANLAAVATDPSTSGEQLRSLPPTLVHSAGGLVVLLAVLVLNIYKPRGVTRYGYRKQIAEQEARLKV